MPGSLLGIRDLQIHIGMESGGSGGSRSEALWEDMKRAAMTTPARGLRLVGACLLDSQAMLSQSNCYI